MISLRAGTLLPTVLNTNLSFLLIVNYQYHLLWFMIFINSCLNMLLGDSAIKSLLHNQAKRKFSDGLHEVAALCLQQEPSQRPTAAQLLTHPYFKFNRKHMRLSEYLLPALPLSDKVAYNRGKL